jgi:hypothetical protein
MSKRFALLAAVAALAVSGAMVNSVSAQMADRECSSRTA